MVREILCIQLRQLGDILLTTPCFKVLKKAFPNARLSFISHKMGQLIVKDHPYVDEHITYHEQMSWREHFTFLKNLRKRRYDVVFDFMNNPRSAIFSFIVKAPHKVAFSSARNWAYNQTPLKPENSHMYIVDEKFFLLKNQFPGLNIASEDRQLLLPWNESDSHLAELELAKRPCNRLRVILSPTHRRPARRWANHNFAHLADRIAQKWQADIYWLWGPGEKPFVEAIRNLCQTPTFLMPATSFREMAAFIANCDLFIGTSNGPSHVAVAVNTMSLQLHGPTNAFSWCPKNQQHIAIQSSEFGSHEASCNAITVDLVWQQLEEKFPLLQEKLHTRVMQKAFRKSWK